MNEGRESLHRWSLVMAVISVVVMAVWMVAPALLSPMGWSVALGVWALAGFGYLFVHIEGHRRWADRVTAVRVLLCVLLFAGHALDPRAAWWKVCVAILIIVLDGVDGALARRHGPTERGAVFDMESDSFYVITMCGVAQLYLGLGAWIYVAGLLRPLYVCMWAVLLLFVKPPSPNRKGGSQRGRIVFLVLIISLITNLAPIIPFGVKQVVSAVAVALLCYSFSIDIVATLRAAERR
jgi:phosphatidylglycerophosphate synthase